MTHRVAACRCGRLSVHTQGAFADPHFPAPTFSVYEERMHGWVRLPEGRQHMR
jgi:hypothetical protein